MLKSIGLKEVIPKLKEKDLTEAEVFFELDVGDLISALDIKTEGKKLKFKEKLKEVKERHEKMLSKLEKDDMCEFVGQLEKAPSVIF
mmetsp:Transcript_8419/g.6280  ORF Transcript_8419/g.6280 Transcript_8419/m.6280 type:complete len:87 (-) Transcript_8419:6-266(-)